jgi:glycosyltransferase involved in cell wall biosynthesis
VGQRIEAGALTERAQRLHANAAACTMNFVFIHQHFPGQYVHIVRYLAAAGHDVVFLTQERTAQLPWVRKIMYAPTGAARYIHPYLRDLEGGVLNGLAVASQCETLKRQGFAPDIVIGHNGWGEILYIKDVWPAVPLLGYFEFFYHPRGTDVDCDPEFPPLPDDAVRLRTRNAVNLVGLHAADWGQTPTRWQHSLYPPLYRERISVIHEGVDTDRVRPDATARIWLQGGLSFSAADELITYSARNLEPYRGFHSFMRALPSVLQQRPHANVLIIGGDGVSYGRHPTRAHSWREQMLAELDGRLDRSRVHFLGKLPYEHYLTILQLSSLHVYLTYPFVLSWSLIEAMSAGCLIVASATPPVEEVISDGVNGYLADMFDADALARRILFALEQREAQVQLRAAARQTALDCYDLNRICIPAYLALLRRLTGVDADPASAPHAKAAIALE